MEGIEARIRSWDGLAVVSRFDAETGTWIFIAMHSDRLGAPLGGTRIRQYESPAEGLTDAMRLAEGMTHKWAAVGLDSGGGKAVLAVPGPLEGAAREGLLRRYAALLNSLKGAFGTGRDLGTTDADMMVLGEETLYVHGVSVAGEPVKDPGPFTAQGVLTAIRSVLARVHGRTEIVGRTVCIQGVGDVGAPLAQRLHQCGVRLILSDVDAERAAEMAAELGADIVHAPEVYDVECDVFAPCAVGAILDQETIPRLRCLGVAGSANNQLAVPPEDAARLHQRGILYAPDYIANGGGALAFGLLDRGVTDDVELYTRVTGLGETLDGIFAEAAERNESPYHAARRLVDRRLEAGRQEDQEGQGE